MSSTRNKSNKAIDKLSKLKRVKWNTWSNIWYQEYNGTFKGGIKVIEDGIIMQDDEFFDKKSFVEALPDKSKMLKELE